MDIYLPIAEISLHLEVILGLGIVVGFISSVFGIGGGFIATPFLIFLGIPPAFAVGTQAVQLVSSSLSGVLGHWSRGNVDVQVGSVMLAGSLTGTILGVGIFHFLQYTGQIDVVINILYVLLLGTIGSMMLFESAKTLLHQKKDEHAGRSAFWHKATEKLPYKVSFPRSGLYISAVVPITLGLIGGLMVSVLGIGGGFFLVPAMIYVLGMPTHLVAGTSLYQILITTAFSAILQAVSNNTVDVVLALMLMLGSLIGLQIGIYASQYIRGATSRLLLALMLLAVCFKLAGVLFIEPHEFYNVEVEQ